MYYSYIEIEYVATSFSPTKTDLAVKLLTAKSVLVGTKNSHSEGFLLAKYTAHKHPHHDEAVCLSTARFLWRNTSHPREPLRKGLDEAAVKGFSIKL
jgi:hypothetical protein